MENKNQKENPKKSQKNNTKENGNITDSIKKKIREKNHKVIAVIIIAIILIIICACLMNIGTIGIEASSNGTIEIIFSDDDLEIVKNEEIDIFSNEMFENEDLIAPGANGTYTFYVSNSSGMNVIYDMTFSDVMSSPVNMMYKLKLNGEYICGSKNEYISIDELEALGNVLDDDEMDEYILEWCWIDDDEEDTKTGILSSEGEREYYTLNLNILAQSY